MSKVENLQDYTSENPTAVTIGTFDGVHIGHQKIISRLIKIAKKDGLKSVVLTFFPHPRMVLQKDTNIKLINTIDERTTILKATGIDFLLVKTFTKAFSRLKAEDFVKEVLVDTLHAKKVIIGYDHRFGRNRNADITDLRKFGETYNFEVEEISAQDIDDVAVSSTKIRNALMAGDIQTANAYLGYNFMLSGTVVKGKALGKDLGFPTANITIKEEYKIIPKYGSYIVSSEIDGAKVYGMMNIGVNPTFQTTRESIEVHFLDFNKIIYNKTIQVDLISRLRDEQKFDSIKALKEQLQRDEAATRRFLKDHQE